MKTPFLKIAPEGMAVICSIAVFGWIFSFLGLGAFSFLALVAFGFCVYFFRDPDRNVCADADSVVSPSDGRVIDVATETEDVFLRREVTRVSVFLSIFDCHVNWFPVSGEVKDSHHKAGKFNFGFSGGASKENEQIATLIKPGGEEPEMLMVQVAGFVARRIVSNAPKGAFLKRGERFGIIKFGSRIDLFFPPGYKVEVKKGDTLRGAETTVARFSLAGGDLQ